MLMRFLRALWYFVVCNTACCNGPANIIPTHNVYEITTRCLRRLKATLNIQMFVCCSAMNRIRKAQFVTRIISWNRNINQHWKINDGCMSVRLSHCNRYKSFLRKNFNKFIMNFIGVQVVFKPYNYGFMKWCEIGHIGFCHRHIIDIMCLWVLHRGQDGSGYLKSGMVNLMATFDWIMWTYACKPPLN